MSIRRLLTTVFVFAAVVAAFAVLTFAQRPQFEVASVRPNNTKSKSDKGRPRRDGEFVTMRNSQLFGVIYYAYQLKGNYEMVGYTPLPEDWNWYDIEAKASASATDDDIRLMFQVLLEDRFKLKVHRETRELPAWELTLLRGGKLAPAREGNLNVTIEGRTIAQRPNTCATTLWQEGSHMVCHAVGMERLVAELSARMQAAVVDRTGLKGNYDAHVVFSETPPGDLFQDAVQSQLGLKLTKGKGPVEVLVVDHLEKPSGN